MSTFKPRVCKLCGKQFIPNSPTQLYCDGPHFKQCAICGKDIPFKGPKTCSKQCMVALRRQTNLQRYGVDNPSKSQEVKDKIKQTTFKHYGVDNANKSEIIRNKVKQAWQEKYGVDNPNKLDSVKKKKKEHYISKYGVEHPWMLDSVQQHRKQVWQEKYGVDNPSKSELIKDKKVKTFQNHYGDGVKAPSQIPGYIDSVEKTSLQRYGVTHPSKSDEIKEKHRETSFQRYGTENPMQNDEVKLNFKKSMKDKYGYDSTFGNPEIFSKCKTTWLERYGFDNPSKVKEIRDKKVCTWMKKYGVDSPLKSDVVKDKIRETVHSRYGVDYACQLPQCRNSGCAISKNNKKVMNRLLESIPGIEASYEFPLDGYSYDIYIKDFNILIEIDPTPVHNDYINIFNQKPRGFSDPYRQLVKTKVANEHGYRCIHIFDWDDLDAVISIINQNKTRVYGRRCNVLEVNVKDANAFFSENHLQSTCRGILKCYALEYNGNIVQMMAFGKPRYNNKYDWELLRLCSKSDVSVIGGASKLYSYAIRNEISNVISYCDYSKFNGDVYRQLGMQFVHATKPSKVWSKGKNRITSNMLNSLGYDKIFGTDYGKYSSNEELMINSGWLPVYDCGQLVFEDKE